MLAKAADTRPIAVGILIAGHTRNVWQTDRRSAHSADRTADIHAVGGKLVVLQQATGTAAHQLATELAAGSPKCGRRARSLPPAPRAPA